jgi:hypothetical protein
VDPGHATDTQLLGNIPHPIDGSVPASHSDSLDHMATHLRSVMNPSPVAERLDALLQENDLESAPSPDLAAQPQDEA